jgi:hypothetical protein
MTKQAAFEPLFPVPTPENIQRTEYQGGQQRLPSIKSLLNNLPRHYPPPSGFRQDAFQKYHF